MKQLLNYFLSVLSFSAFASCTHEVILPDTDMIDNSITIDEALANLNYFNRCLETSQPEFVRSIELVSKEVSDIQSVYPHSVIDMTRSAAMSVNDTQPLVYVVNYKNDEGFVILSADKRLSGEVIAVTEKGNMDNNLMILCKSDINNSQSEFPVFLKEFLSNYIESCLYSAKFDIDRNAHSNIDTKSGSLVQVLPFFTNWWGQWSPFNNYCPVDNGIKCPAGCVAVATSMAVTYLKRNFTSTLLYGRSIDYSSLQNAYRVPMGQTTPDYVDSSTRDVIAWVVHSIGQSVHTSYHDDASSAELTDVANYLDSLGYDASRKLNFKVSYATSMLPAGKPIIMSGYSNALFANGHAWIVDGINQYFAHPADDEIRTMLHCNWGWDGIGNGYFYDDAFCPLDHGSVSYFDGRFVTEDDGVHNHNYYHRTVVY